MLLHQCRHSATSSELLLLKSLLTKHPGPVQGSPSMAGLCKVYCTQCVGINSKNSIERLFAETTKEPRKVNMGAATYNILPLLWECEMARGGTLWEGISSLSIYTITARECQIECKMCFFLVWAGIGILWEFILLANPYYPHYLHQKMPGREGHNFWVVSDIRVCSRNPPCWSCILYALLCSAGPASSQ